MFGANPDPETMKFAFWISVGIIGLLIIIVGVLYNENKKFSSTDLVQVQKAQREQMDKLATVVETTRETVNSLKTLVEIVKQQQDERDPRTERRLNEHSVEIKGIKDKVARLETRCDIHHSKQG